jgi:hypothetical protein
MTKNPSNNCSRQPNRSRRGAAVMDSEAEAFVFQPDLRCVRQALIKQPFCFPQQGSLRD